MLIAVLVFALLLTCIGLYISRDIFSPYVAVSGVWSIAILIYYFLPNTFYPICNDFPFALAIWLTGFFLGCHADVWRYKRADTNTQFAGHAVVESIDLLFAILGLLQYFLGTRQ